MTVCCYCRQHNTLERMKNFCINSCLQKKWPRYKISNTKQNNILKRARKQQLQFIFYCYSIRCSCVLLSREFGMLYGREMNARRVQYIMEYC